ncbi:MAG: hypothetical protein LC792_08610 [Actinobacteria bacterium]|nr:hypothetical protein [Actinomycetota bacterium]
MIRRLAVVVGLILGSSLAPARATGWSAAAAPGAVGRAVTTILEPVDSALTATCMVGALGLSLTIRLGWTDTPQAWVDGYEWRQRVGGNSYPDSGTSEVVVTPAPHTYTVDVPITAAGVYHFAVRSKGQAWRSVDVESPARTVTKPLGLTYNCS